MRTKSVIVLIIVILVIIGIIAVVVSMTSKNTNVPATPATSAIQTPATQNIVTYTDNGFSPSPITVHVGDSVTFTNSASGDMWVASNPHPTHTDLPGFDEKNSATPGQSWTYTFVKAGTWGYHNHRNPSQGGAVIVQ